jgi:hypothetical protein
MNFLFSSPIGRAVYLGRLVLAALALTLGYLLFKHLQGTDATKAFDPVALGAAAVVVLPAYLYLVFFGVLPRLKSIKSSNGYVLIMAAPLLVALIQGIKAYGGDAWAGLFPWQGVCSIIGYIFVFFLLILIILPGEIFHQGNVMQALLHEVEEGQGRILMRIVPLTVVLATIALLYDLSGLDVPNWGHLGGVYHGLNDAQSMDNAQLARQISRGDGFTTEVIRPHAVTDLRNFVATQGILNGGSSDLFPPDRFPPGSARVIPDTYNPPGYPVLLAVWFRIVHPKYDQTPAEMGGMSSQDRVIPWLNQLFLPLTALLIFALGYRLFDDRVAWMAMMAFFLSNMVWQFSITALSTTLLMFLVTAFLLAASEIFRVSEDCAASTEPSFWPAWAWGLVLALFLGAACLTRLHLLILLVPVFIFVLLLPHRNILLFAPILLVVIGMVAPWFWHVYQVSGNPLGSNMPLLILGQEGYDGDQIFRATSIPSYEQIFRDVGNKEYVGFRWHFERAWDLLGSNPMILLFAASMLHRFKRQRAQIFRWLVLLCAVALIAANNMAIAKPEPIGPWNTVVILFPAMLVVGTAFFFVLLDRMGLQLWLFNNAVVIAALALTSVPLVQTITLPDYKTYNYPPYVPPFIKFMGQFAHRDEWVATDMPWATAWYADRGSLWIPDSLTDFIKINDNVCPTGVMLLTPATLSQPAMNLTTGENKEWLPFFTGTNIPAAFPLRAHTVTRAGDPEYAIWCDYPRWQK